MYHIPDVNHVRLWLESEGFEATDHNSEEVIYTKGEHRVNLFYPRYGSQMAKYSRRMGRTLKQLCKALNMEEERAKNIACGLERKGY